jgi:hypothetical protein
MWLAGIPLRSEHVVELARFLALDGFADTAILLLRADADGEKSVSLDVGDKARYSAFWRVVPRSFSS